MTAQQVEQGKLQSQDNARPFSAPSAATLRWRGAAVAALISLYGLIACYAADSSLPTNALTLPGQNQQAIRSLLPEGWAFFTRSPREKDVLLWRRVGNQWQQWSLNQASATEWFGVKREQRAQSVEMGLLLSRAVEKGAHWSDCEAVDVAKPLGEIVRQCAHSPGKAGPPVRVRSGSPTPTLCGPIALTRQEPLPWSWARFGVEEQMPVQILRMEVSC
ncbi:SdpA family antimicrobial peptide system protein [Streptomyces sp. NPDC021096]|uniref:SdpA family antimicrobial peptide system protein n=1 Tax=Streptomyces sp. NPDC021096 TaxID=3154792 RepID=UPI0033DD8E59